MSHHSDFDPWQEPTPKVDWVTKDDADRKAYRAFWRGITFGGLLTGIAFIFRAALGVL